MSWAGKMRKAGIESDGIDIDLYSSGADYKREGVALPRIHRVKVSLTNAQIKAMRATPVTLVAAPGASKFVEFVSAVLKLTAGTEVLTETIDNMAIKYTNGTGLAVSGTIESTGFIDQAANTYTNAQPASDAIAAATGVENQALVLHNTGDGEFAGNASADATMAVYINYIEHTV